MLSFTISLNGESLGALSWLSILEAGRDMRHPTETDGMGGNLQITAFSMSGSAITLDFSAVATRLELNIPAEFIEGA